MAQAILNQIPLLDPSFIYYCQVCRKSLRNSVRIIAKLNVETSCCINLCPPCLAASFQELDIQYYYICRKMDQRLGQLANLTTEEALECIKFLQNQGIQQMCFKQLEPNNSKIFNCYNTLNKHIFDKNQFGVDLGRKESMVSDNGLQRQKPNPPNRKHLKTLGYNWQRREFGYQPQIVFGYLMGSLDQNERNDDDQNELRQTVFKYYDDQIKKVNQVSDFMVETNFLLGRKGIFESESVPSEITELRKLQINIKNLITQICQITNQDENEIDSKKQKQDKNIQAKKNKKHKHKERRSTSQVREVTKTDDRSRTREKKKKKNVQQFSIQGNSIQKNTQKQKDHIPLLQNKTVEPSKKEQISISSSSDGKRKRGRPTGSKNKLKLESDLETNKLVLKMSFDNKKVRLQKKKEEKRKQHKTQTISQQFQIESKQQSIQKNQDCPQVKKQNDTHPKQQIPKRQNQRKRVLEINSSGQ